MTLLGAGKASPADLNRALLEAPILIGLDGGGDQAIKLGHTPALVTGDLDSLGAEARAHLGEGRILCTPDQDSTDLDKALEVLPDALLLCLGVSGARLDHTLATLSTLVRNPSRRIVVIAEDDIVFLAPRQMRMELAPGSRLSLFPVVPLRAESRGLEWPLDGLDLSPDGRIGNSNRVTGPVSLSVSDPGLVVLLERGAGGGAWPGENALRQAMAVMAAPTGW